MAACQPTRYPVASAGQRSCAIRCAFGSPHSNCRAARANAGRSGELTHRLAHFAPQSGALSQSAVRVTGRMSVPFARMTKMSGSPPRPDLANVIHLPSGEKEYESTVVPA